MCLSHDRPAVQAANGTKLRHLFIDSLRTVKGTLMELLPSPICPTGQRYGAPLGPHLSSSPAQIRRKRSFYTAGRRQVRSILCPMFFYDSISQNPKEIEQIPRFFLQNPRNHVRTRSLHSLGCFPHRARGDSQERVCTQNLFPLRVSLP